MSNPATIGGIRHLVDTQRRDGSWDEPHFTGTGFPGYGVGQRLGAHLAQDERICQGDELPAGFMINYHMYRNYWPLMALGRYRRLLRGEDQPAPQRANQGGERALQRPSNRLHRLLRMW